MSEQPETVITAEELEALERPEIAITAGALADHVDSMIAIHGDLPLVQWDHDTWSTLGTAKDCVSRRDTDEGPVIAVASMGYSSDEEEITASVFVAELRAAIAEHGDLPVQHHDADTSWLLPYRAQVPDAEKGVITIMSVGYSDI